MKEGDVVTRIWGDGYMVNKMRVCAVDDEFIYCNAQSFGGDWIELPKGSEPWKFDKKFGVETDEEMGWGVEPYGRNLVLTRIQAAIGEEE